MSNEKPIVLYDYFQREIKQLLNPTGINRPQQIAQKLSMWSKNNTIEGVRKRLSDYVFEYNNQEFMTWVSELDTLYEEEKDEMINKVIDFYIQKSKLTSSEKEFYKEFQRTQFQNEKR